jgi:SagB-type dehydrogenase family enzyme
MKAITLPAPRVQGERSLEEVLAARRSVRAFRPDPLTTAEVGQLLWAAQGVTGDRPVLRAAPSAGACCPLELYLCRADGVWHYEPVPHRLALQMEDDVRGALATAAWGQGAIAQAPAVFVVSAVFGRTTARYGERGRLRYVPMDAGHAAENLLLQAVALGLGGVAIGAFDDTAVARVLHLPVDQEPLYLLPVGRPAAR